MLSSIRRFEPGNQRSLDEILEATIIPDAVYLRGRAQGRKARERVALRAAEIGLVRKEAAELTETLENGLMFPGVELLMPLAKSGRSKPIFDYLPEDTLLWLVEPGRVIAQAERFAEQVSRGSRPLAGQARLLSGPGNALSAPASRT